MIFFGQAFHRYVKRFSRIASRRRLLPSAKIIARLVRQKATRLRDVSLLRAAAVCYGAKVEQNFVHLRG
jgi:hypothetical protein